MPDLDHFPVLQVTPPAPDVVRLRGDRLRRRTAAAITAAASVVVAAVAIPLALHAGMSDRGVPAPIAQSRPAEPVGGWRTTIPEDFPLGDGMLGTVPTGPLGSPTVYEAACGDLNMAAPVTGMAAYLDPPAGKPEETRALALYRSADQAQSLMKGYQSSVNCTSDSDPALDTYPLDMKFGGDASVAFVNGDTSNGQQRIAVLYLRIGNAILTDQETPPDSSAYADLDTEKLGYELMDDMVQRNRGTVKAMCLFSAAGCAATAAPTPVTAPPAEGTSSTAGSSKAERKKALQKLTAAKQQTTWNLDSQRAYTPESFSGLPLSAGLSGDDFSVVPLSDSIQLCETAVQPASTPEPAAHAISQIGGGLSPADHGTVTRDIAVYDSRAEAQKPYDALQKALATCDVEVSTAWSGHAYSIDPLRIDGGLAWLRTTMDAADSGAVTGEEVWVATLSGRALLIQHVPVDVALPQASTKAATTKALALLSDSGTLRAALATRLK